MTQGFTLIELLLVVVIIGIVAAFVLPKFGDVKEKAYVSAMKNDLRNLATDQEIYFEEHGQYRPATVDTDLNVPTSDNVHLQYPAASGITGISNNPTSEGYVARAQHDQLDSNYQCFLNRTNGEVEAWATPIGVGELWCHPA